MQANIFKEYDIRGIVGTELIIDQTYDLTRAILAYAAGQGARIQHVVVGMDGRLSSPLIKDRMIAALVDAGISVTFIGICPSPVLYFALHRLPVDMGLMITASHNPKEYNGIKICLGTSCVWGKQIQEIRRLYFAKEFLQNSHTSDKGGSIIEYPILDEYIAWMVNHFAQLKNLKIPFIIDCGSGAGAAVIPRLVQAMGWQQVRLQCCEIDGNYPHHEADPTVEKNVQDVKALLATTDAQFGIGFDGDADRMGAISKKGVIIPGDQLLAIFAREILAEHPGAAIVFDVKASQGLVELITSWGGKPIMSPCGHAIVKEQMVAHQALLGGELSCHFMFVDDYFGFDDAIYAMMRLLKIIYTTGKSLEELVAVFPSRFTGPDLRIPCDEHRKKEIINQVRQQLQKMSEAQLTTLDGVRFTLPYGWGIVRASNTQPMINMRFESETQEGLAKITKMVFAMARIPCDQ